MTVGNEGAETVRAMGSIDEVFVLDGLERSPRARELPVVGRSDRVFFRGWAAHPSHAVAARRIAMFVDGVEWGVVRARRRRPDVADHFASADMLRVGFLAHFDASTVASGRHDVRFVLNDGESALPPIPIDVAALEAPATSFDPSAPFEVVIDEISDMPPGPNGVRRIEFGMRALVRGSFSTAFDRDVHDVYAVVDECDAVPVQTYGSRFFTGFATADLEIGTHALRFVTTIRGERKSSAEVAFEVVPACFGRFQTFSEVRIVPASIDWADREPTVSRACAEPREFARGAIAYVRGWAIDDVRRDSASAVTVRFDCGARFAMQTRAERRDVAASLGMERAANCGFVGAIATASLGPGRNVGRCEVVAKDRASVFATEATVEIIVRER